MHSLKYFAIIFLGFTAFVATAQSQKLTLRASEFNVEILNLDDRPHTLALYEPPSRGAYIAHVNLKRISEWKPSAEVPTEASALRLQFWLEGNIPQIEVSAYLDKITPRTNPEWEKMATMKVVSRALAQDETVTISETERFGIQPFQVRVFRAQPWSVGPPLINNKTQALTVDSFSEARPTYTLKVRNVSHKAINAIHYYGIENDRKQGGSGSSATPLIPAGRIFVIQQRFDLAEERLKTTAQSIKREIVIAAVVFADGSFEGEPDIAAELAADMMGNRIQLTRVIPLLRKLAARPRGDSDQLKMLQKDIAALPEDVDAGVANELIERFASASEDMRKRRIKEEVGNGMRYLKNHVLREIEKFNSRREGSSDVELSGWLNDFINDLERTFAH